MARTALIVGAGAAGLAAAARLAHAGWRVRVFEKNAWTGGKIRSRTLGGYRFDAGPTLVTMRWVFDDFFASIGLSREERLPLRAVDPLCRYHFADGSRLDLWSDPDRRREAVRAFAPGEELALDRYLDRVRRMYAVSEGVFLRNEFGPASVARFLRPAHLRDLPFFLSGATLHELHARTFRDPRLIQLFDRFATYNGSSPYRTPSTFAVIAHVELEGGAWTPVGGMHAIATALTDAAAEAGADIVTEAPVERILFDRGRAAGVALRGGGMERGDVVIVTQDAITAHDTLLADVPSAAPRARALRTREPSCSGFVLLTGIRHRHPELAHHTIFFSRDYRTEFEDLFIRRQPADDMTIYVSVSSRLRPEDAPDGCDNAFVLVNAPALHADGRKEWSAEQRTAYRDRVLERLAERGLDIRADIDVEEACTPSDFAVRDNAFRGALYGHASNSSFSAFLRPPIAPRSLPGVFFAGGTTHPGGGVPLALLSAELAVRRASAWAHERARA